MPENKLLRFYNMHIHLMKDNRLVMERAAVKRLLQKAGNTFFDIYIYRDRKSYIFDSHFIHDLSNEVTGQYYESPEKFIKEYYKKEEVAQSAAEQPKLDVNIEILKPLKIDLNIMVYVAKCEKGKVTPVKEKIIFDYIQNILPTTKNLSQQYLQACLYEIHPSIEHFYEALKNIISKTPEEATNLLRECVKICLSDGRLHYNEKVCLAELVQILRDNGVNADVGL